MSSTADAGDVVEVSDEGITVTKRYTPDEFPVPAVRFEITSEHDEPVDVRLSEDIPESFPMDGVGFHPEYHSDQWTAFQDHHVEFTGTIEPDDSLVTVYGVRLGEDDDGGQFLTEPTIVDVRSPDSSESEADDGEEVEEETTIDDIVSEDRNQVVKDMLSGDSSGIPGLGDDESESASPETEAAAELDLDLGDVDTEPVDEEEEIDDEPPDIDVDFAPDDGETAADDSSEPDTNEPSIELDIDAAAERVADADGPSETVESDDDSDSPTVEADISGADSDMEGSAVSDPTGSVHESVESSSPDAFSSEEVAPTLAEEIRSGTVADDDIETIRAALEGSPSGTDLAKVDHLQSRVESVAAYAGALEEFLDENGTGRQLIEEFKTDLESLDEELSSLADRVDATESTVNSVEETVQAVSSSVDEMDSKVESLATDLGETDETVSMVDERVDSVEADLTDLDDDVTDLDDDVTDLDEDVTDLDDDVTDLGGEVTDIDDTVTDLDDTVGDLDDTVGDLDDTVGHLDEDVDELDDELASVSTTVDGVAETVDEVSETVVDVEDEVADLSEDVDSVRADVTDIVEWRDQLGSMFSDD